MVVHSGLRIGNKSESKIIVEEAWIIVLDFAESCVKIKNYYCYKSRNPNPVMLCKSVGLNLYKKFENLQFLSTLKNNDKMFVC